MEAETYTEHSRLVRLCAYLTGDVDAAEDLAQETLFEAWRDAHELRDPDRRAQWLAGIARNVCRMWARRRGRELARLVRPDVGDGPMWSLLEDPSSGNFDVEVDLERHELATLLDRALALLPPDTRSVLIARYIEETPLAEVAARLHISEGTLAVRLHRGKLALRRVLVDHFHAEAAAYGLIDGDAGTWQETRIWCSLCGQRRLLVRLPDLPGTIAFRCPNCTPAADESGWNYPLSHQQFARMIGGYTRPKSIFGKMATWAYTYYTAALEHRTVTCTKCGAPASLQIYVPDSPSASNMDLPGYITTCATCGTVNWTALNEMLRGSRAIQQFEREHLRIRTLPAREVEADGQPALVLRFESVTSAAGLDVVCARNTFRLIDLHGYPSQGRGQ